MAKAKAEQVAEATAQPNVAGQNPASADEWVPLATIKHWSRNPRKNDEAVDGVARSIIAFGWGAPLLVRSEDRRIIAGHTRAKAAARLAQLWRRERARDREAWHPDAIRTKDTGEVPVRWKSGLSDAAADALAVADNKLGEKAAWDNDLLAMVLTDVADAGLIADVGFSDGELDKLLGDTMAGLDSADTTVSPFRFAVVVDCRDERHQGEVLTKLEADGYECRPLIT